MSYAKALAAAQELRTALLDHGVRAVSIELQPGASSSGWYSGTHIRKLSHHIVSARSQGLTPGLALVKRGRADLPPPLCNLYGGFDEISRIICMAWANHPGQGGPRTYAGLTIPGNNGRPYLLGTEFEGGLHEADWTDSFREFMGRHNAGVLDYLGTGPDGHDEHSGWAEPKGRKIDRLGYTTDSGRAEIRRYWTAPEEDALTPEQMAELKAHVDKGLAEMYRRITRAEFDGKLSPTHYPNSLANLRVLLGGQGESLAAVRTAVAAVQADQSVAAATREKALALLTEIEADLPEPTPEVPA